jgi:alkylated DNA nucleotide flippase Atl1
MTYGDVAEYAGASSPRIVGRVLALDDGSVPWHRVLRANGTLAEHLYTEQRQRLLAEGSGSPARASTSPRIAGTAASAVATAGAAKVSVGRDVIGA